MSLYQLALQYVLEREDGLKEPLNDPGGIKNMGLSLRTLKETPVERLRLYGIPVYVTADVVRELTREQVGAFYRREVWDHAAFEGINDQGIANYVFDMAIAMGIAPAVKCVQRALWSTRNSRGSLVDDGILNDETLRQVNYTDSVYLLAAIRSERGGEHRIKALVNPIEYAMLDEWLDRSYNQST